MQACAAGGPACTQALWYAGVQKVLVILSSPSTCLMPNMRTSADAILRHESTCLSLRQPGGQTGALTVHACCNAAGGSTVVTVAPIMSHSGVDFAPIGLIDMLNPGGAMLAVSCDTSPKRWHTGSSTSTSNRQRRIVPELCLQMEVRGAGKFAVFCSRRPLHCRVTEREVEHQYDADSGLLTFCLERGGPTEHVVTLVL